MGAFLLGMLILIRSTTQAGLVAEVIHPTVLRCLTTDFLRLLIDMAKQCGLLIRPKLSAREATNLRTHNAQNAITNNF